MRVRKIQRSGPKLQHGSIPMAPSRVSAAVRAPHSLQHSFQHREFFRQALPAAFEQRKITTGAKSGGAEPHRVSTGLITAVGRGGDEASRCIVDGDAHRARCRKIEVELRRTLKHRVRRDVECCEGICGSCGRVRGSPDSLNIQAVQFDAPV